MIYGMKKTIFFAAAALLSVVACEQELIDVNEGGRMTFEATVEGADTKTVLDGVNNFWFGEEKITVMDGAVAKGFSANATEKAKTVRFVEDDFTKLSGDDYLAVYPAVSSENANWSGDAGEPVKKVRLADIQKVVAGSFDPSAHLAIAYAEEGAKEFAFKNVVALIKFTVGNDNVTNPRFFGHNGEVLSGDFNLWYNDGDPVADVADYDGYKHYSYAKLEGSLTKGETYYIAVLPTNLEKGLTIEFTIDGVQYQKAGSKKSVIERNMMLDLGTITFDVKTPGTEANGKWVKGLESKLACANTVFGIEGKPFMHKIRVPDYTEYNKTSAANVKPYKVLPVTDGIKRVYNLPEGLTWNEKRFLVEGIAPAAGDYVYTVEFTQNGTTYKEGIKLHVAASSSDLLSPTPIIGWQTWNVLGENINEDKLSEQLSGMRNLGLIDAGYKYFGIDDAWQLKSLSNGHQQINTARFKTVDGVNGMKRMADKIHSYGLKAGIYTDCGIYTCGGGGSKYAGSYGYEEVHAQDYYEWGYDFVKEDWYYNTTMAPGYAFTNGYDGLSSYWNTKTMAQELYTKMGTALANRGIILYMCEWGIHDPWKWGAETGATCWRMSYDDSNAWKSTNQLTSGPNEGVNNNRVGVYASIVLMRNLWPYVGINRYNDADMLCVGIDASATGPGNDDCYSGKGLSKEEAQTAFAMWCMWSSPILLGFDMTQSQSTIASKLGYDAVGLLKNTELVAIQQDPLGQGAEHIKTSGNLDYYMKDLANGDVAIAVVNLGDYSGNYSIRLSDFNALDSNSTYSVRDLIKQSGAGVLTSSSPLSGSLAGHDTYIIRLSKN